MIKLIHEREPELAAHLADGLRYVIQHREAATLPDVGPIFGSMHGDICVEVRTSLDPGNHNVAHLRTIVYLVPTSDIVYVALCGDKSRRGNDWYSDAVPAADRYYAAWLDNERKGS